ncbi:MAG: hypothetical protein SGBAC_000409 [Bacillariaceae sp.]
MSSNALFADDSSDEDEETPAVTTQEKSTDEEAKEDEKPTTASEDKDDSEAKSSDKETKTPSRPSLFGDDSDDESDAKFDDVEGSSAPAQSSKTSEDAASPSKASNRLPENATVLNASRPDDGVTMHMTKLPNLLAIQPAAFEESTYSALDEEDLYKGVVHNMVRWRYKKNQGGDFERDSAGGLIRESNSKLVKWEDGSYTLHIGDESFVAQTVDHRDGESAGLKSFVYLSQKATFSSNDDGDDKANGGTVLECIGGVVSRLIPKPSSLQSEAHKSLTVAVRQRTLKRSKIAEYVTQEDPEKLRADRIRTNAEEDKIRARKSGGYRVGGGGGRRRTPGMNRRYMEEDDDDDYDTTNISAMKKGAIEDDMDDYGDESDDSDGYNDTFRNRNRKRQKRALEEDEDDEEELVFDDDEDDDEVALAKAPTKKRSHQAVVDDDSD